MRKKIMDKERGVSLSKLTTEFFKSLVAKEQPQQKNQKTPLTKELFGILKGSDIRGRGL